MAELQQDEQRRCIFYGAYICIFYGAYIYIFYGAYICIFYGAYICIFYGAYIKSWWRGYTEKPPHCHCLFASGFNWCPVDSPHKGSVMWTFDGFFAVSQNKPPNKQSSCMWFGDSLPLKTLFCLFVYLCILGWWCVARWSYEFTVGVYWGMDKHPVHVRYELTHSNVDGGGAPRTWCGIQLVLSSTR